MGAVAEIRSAEATLDGYTGGRDGQDMEALWLEGHVRLREERRGVCSPRRPREIAGAVVESTRTGGGVVIDCSATATFGFDGAVPVGYSDGLRIAGRDLDIDPKLATAASTDLVGRIAGAGWDCEIDSERR